ncbi:metalloregulator ArsR/SmtB family transcription factor [Paenibacillus oenotherae]|uniref:Metalloregulator ArsR/SmtB family transcription factor n=1 Tax=Paenibacillus oenotherae TaxID=1435645 RepID=A0ABS7D7N9_9BACL|nr:metalloregulator ArsR/SmtB family transcription factor [Paenibacillus oenotherae]MBW7475178.1 metalloregulator ArsR/SmtB family transcription factor [Paenibacillus oenotherae]
MQLDKVVNYHKALADTTRMRMLILLADGEHNGGELAEKLCISPATVTHHAAKLREASLINERRDKNTIYFTLNDYFVKSGSTAAVDLIYRNAAGVKEGDGDGMEDKNKRLKDSVVKNFFTSEGKLKHVPAQLKKKLIVLEELVLQLEKGRKYTERELNAFIGQFHEDYATIRREFIMHQFMFRENEIYELNPSELWAKWEVLS